MTTPSFIHTYATSSITVGDRIRTSIPEDKIAELADSIEAIGLIHAPIITPGGVLIAGGCRLAAMTRLHEQQREFSYSGSLIPLDHIPVVPHSGDLSPDDLLEIEIEENVRRTDLTWQDRTQALNKLHTLRQSQNPKQTIDATTREAFNLPEGEFVSREKARSVSKSAILTEHLSDPLIASGWWTAC